MNVSIGLAANSGVDCRVAVGDAQLLDWHDGIGPCGQHRASHDLDAVTAICEGQRRVTGTLQRLNAQTTLPGAQCRRIDCNAVHRDPIERRLVAFAIHVFAQNGVGTLRQRQRLNR